MSDKDKPSILLLAAPDTSASVLYGLYDVLFSVGAVYPDMATGVPGQELLDVRVVSAEGTPFHCIGNIPVEPHGALDAVETADAVVVCDMYLSIYEAPRGRHPREVAWLKRMHAGGALLTSVCSGALLLAETGLLNGHTATAHWAYRDTFQRHYPQVAFSNNAILCLEGEADRLVTAAGVSAWQDLAITASR